jgi:hypothetical protein
MLPAGGGLLRAQDGAVSPSAEVEALIPIDRNTPVDVVGSDIEKNLNSLLETVKRAQDEITGQQVTSEAAATPLDAAVLAAPLTTQPLSVATNKNDQSKRVSDLKKRINLLQRLRRREAIEKRNTTKQPSATASMTPPLIPSAIPSAPSAEVQRSQPTLSAIEENLKPETMVNNAEPAQPEIAKATQILKAPVDHLSLAESLYRTRNYAASLKTLKSIDDEQLNASDKTWMELLIALCHRRLGNSETAEAQFREISNAKIADRSVPLARWWLKQTEISATTTQTLTSISSDLDSLIERSQNHAE